MKSKGRVYLGKRPRRTESKPRIILPWEKEESGTLTLEGCPRAPAFQRLPDRVHDRLQELSKETLGVVIFFRTEPVRSGDIQLATGQFLNWTGGNEYRWIAFVDERIGAAWSHPASLYVFGNNRRGWKIRCDCPVENLWDRKTWQIY